MLTSSQRWSGVVLSQGNLKIFSAVLVTGLATVFATLLSLLREQYVASFFGTSDALDAYLIAFLLPAVVSSVAAGSLSASSLPTFIHIREARGRDAAQSLLSSITFLSVVVLSVTSVVASVAAPHVCQHLVAEFGEEKIRLTTQLSYVMIPTIVISGVITVWSSAINASEKFLLTGAYQAAVPLVALLVLLLWSDRLGVFALAVGFTLGVLLQLAVVARGVRGDGPRLAPRWHGFDPDVWQVIGQYLPMVAGQLLISVGLLIDQSMAATLGAGSFAALNYGNKAVALVLGVGATALGTAALPHFPE
jgi:putative peptidoglycan lipid II flippase